MIKGLSVGEGTKGRDSDQAGTPPPTSQAGHYDSAHTETCAKWASGTGSALNEAALLPPSQLALLLLLEFSLPILPLKSQ